MLMPRVTLKKLLAATLSVCLLGMLLGCKVVVEMAGSMTRIVSEVAPSEAAVMNDGCWTVVAPVFRFPHGIQGKWQTKTPPSDTPI